MFLLWTALGCTYIPNYFREDGPSTTSNWDSPTATDVKAHHAPATAQQRGWPVTTAAPENGAVAHLPLYFEDPFEDKGAGRTDATHPHNVYRGGWEDYVALAYCPWRFLGNAGLLPVSAVVTMPWTIMESDGELSRQLLGYDHDAARTPHHVFEAAPVSDASSTAQPRASEHEAPASAAQPTPTAS
jgi:hypothetical protein